jgi:hypothetical protein
VRSRSPTNFGTIHSNAISFTSLVLCSQSVFRFAHFGRVPLRRGNGGVSASTWPAPNPPRPAQASPEKGDAPPPTTTHHSLQCEEPAKAAAVHFHQGELEP